MSRVTAGLLGALVVFFGAQTFVAPGRIALGAASARHTRSTRTQTNAVQFGTAHNPVIVYVNALIELAKKENESVQVAKEILHWKREMIDKDLSDRDLLNEVYLYNDKNDISELQRAKKLLEVFKPKSKVLTSFVTLLGKKKRINMLKDVITVFVKQLYELQSIAPVRLVSAEKLSSEEEATLKTKLKGMLGVKDIKLVTKIDPTLLGGFKVEYGFSDPELMSGEFTYMDFSLASALKGAAAAVQL